MSKALDCINVLVVDDQDCLVDLLSDIVEGLGFSSEVAHDGQEALEKFQGGNFQMVITDIKMPRMDGIQLTKMVKRDRPDVPVIAITGFGNEEAGEDLRSEQMDGFLEKPFRIAKIEGMICEVLRGYNLIY
ncbi:MAG: response regulator [Candidatus Coatesbacteria bacterium]|nr:response regulator [Candidatus Coatesbacteria bacterium]